LKKGPPRNPSPKTPGFLGLPALLFEEGWKAKGNRVS
jgi:hypothetical protein